MKSKFKFFFVLFFAFIFITDSSAQDFLSNLPKVKLKDSYKEKSVLKFHTPGKSIFKNYKVNSDIISSGIKSKKKSYVTNPHKRLNDTYVPWESKKRFWAGFGEVALLEFIPFAMSAYIKDWTGVAEINWTKISFKSMWHNLSSGWFYDGDNFLTNFYAHPYHGSLFYNAGRTNGYNFWESSAFAMSGSVFWEQFMETWEPAFNDWVLTSLNGINLGEITYRLSTLITDNNARGSTRTWLEIAGAVINPVRGFNRLLTGETSRIFPNPEWRTPENLELTFSAGSRRLDQNNGVNFAKDGVQEGLFEFDLKYGNYYKHLSKPFSDFRINIQVGTSGPNLTQLTGIGNLFGFNTKNGKTAKHYFITTLNYNYINNPGFLFGSASIAGNYIMNFKVGKASSINTNFNLQIIPMGATPDDYFEGPEGRNYDFGPGVGFGLSGTLKNGRWNIVDLRYNGGWIWTQSEPPDSRHHLHYANAEVQYPMKDYFAIGLSGGVYWRNSYYKNDPDVNFTTPIARVFFKTFIQNSGTPFGQSSQLKDVKSIKEYEAKGWKENLSDIILLESSYFRNLGEFSQTYNKAYGVYANYGIHYSNSYHLIFKSGYTKFDYRNESYNDSSNNSFYAVPIQIGGRYYVLKKIVMPYFSFMNGVNVIIQDRNLDGGDDKQTLVRYTWQAGFGLMFKIMKPLNLDLNVKYNDNFYDPSAMMTSFEYGAGLSFNIGN